ncbi:MAG TPA: neutral zinc metallopeptidase, partial [Acidimicrobiales bacterium]|nr:neutral zinc metallopeptidase [Acidimicrobiales bacterium]
MRVRRGGGAGFGGLPIPIPMGRGGGITGMIVLVLVLLVGGSQCLGGGGGGGTGIDLNDVLDQFPGAQAAPSNAADEVPGAPNPDSELIDFLEFVVDDIQQTWTGLFRESGEEYRPADLVVFESSVQTGCGGASSSVGPFYCPPDETAYLDLDFFRELSDRFQAPGDFAQAYVVAHEYGHHVQNVLGISGDVRREQQDDPDQENELSIRLELQADCFAGIWGHSVYNRGILEDGDLQEGLDAAAAVGDDRIQ